MIPLPDFANPFEHENAFYLTCDGTRLQKVIAHFEMVRRTASIAGDIVECGVFKGASFIRLAMFRAMLGLEDKKHLIGFDTFDDFPETAFEADRALRQAFIDSAGSQSIGTDQLHDILARKGLAHGVDLFAGDIVETAPAFARAHPQRPISLLHVDVDVYEPAQAVVDALVPLMPPGGVIGFDDYGTFPGETQVADRLAARLGVSLEVLPYAPRPVLLTIPRR